MADLEFALDHFVAGVPPFGYFTGQIDTLNALVKSSREETINSLNPTAEVCLIGLSAYFEAFCKAQFAGLVNICPEILRNFVERRQNATVSLKHILSTRDHVIRKLGNLFSEEYDFGSAKEINRFYFDLLRISPFSHNETKKYEQFLADRNLLVHHGGVYTIRYTSQRFARRSAPGLAHWDSLVVGKREFAYWSSYILAMAEKIAETSQRALQQFIVREKIKLSAQQKSAIRFLN